jgi:hypothetical protein
MGLVATGSGTGVVAGRRSGAGIGSVAGGAVVVAGTLARGAARKDGPFNGGALGRFCGAIMGPVEGDLGSVGPVFGAAPIGCVIGDSICVATGTRPGAAFGSGTCCDTG